MADFEAEEIFQTFYKIPPKSCDYCVVCYRTGKETRLIKPQAFKKFVTAEHMRFNLDPHTLICHICERQALAAYKFREATLFAIAIKKLFQQYMLRRTEAPESKERLRFACLLSIKKSEYGQHISKWQTDLKKIRARTEMHQTEVLVIDTLGMLQVSPQERRLPADDGSEVFIVPDEPEELMRSLPSNNNGTLHTDSVILIDEDDMYPTGESSQEQQRNTLQNFLEQPLIHLPEKTIEFQDPLSPQPIETIIIPSAPNLNTPSLVSAPNLMSTPSVGAIQANLLPPPVVPLQKSRNGYILHPIIVNTSGALTVPSLTSNLVNCMVPGGNNSNKVMVFPDNKMDEISNAQYKDTSNSVQYKNVTNEKMKNLNDLIRPLVNEIKNDMNKGFSAEGVKRKVGMEPIITDVKTVDAKKMKEGQKSKIAVQKNDRIDWEDKIPMDVISFMDAVDPNAGGNIFIEVPKTPLKPPIPIFQPQIKVASSETPKFRQCTRVKTANQIGTKPVSPSSKNVIIDLS